MKIYAAGASHKKLLIPGKERLSGRGVSVCALCDGGFYQNKTVAVIGGGDTALEDALYLSDIAKKVYLIHRRSEYRAAEINVQRIKEKENVEKILNTSIAEIIGEEQVEAVILNHGEKIAVDAVFIAVGMEPKSELIKEFADLDDYGYVMAGENGETKSRGLFVAGDVRTKKLRQVVTAVAEGANVATAAAEYIKGLFAGN